jgi:hypothetical protein
MIKSFGIVPKKVGPRDARVGGYVLADFEDSFTRYLEPVSDRQSAPNAKKGAFDSDTRTQAVK